MVKASGVYLFIGQDSISKEARLKKIKEEFLSKGIEQFSFDTLYAKDFNLKQFQERLLFFPFKSPKRIIVIKNAQDLKEEIRDFILRYIKKPFSRVLLVLDITSAGYDREEKLEEFIHTLTRYAQVVRFREEPRGVDSFMLARQIDLKKPEYALRILNQLYRDGEKPERILGGLRYSWQKYTKDPLEKRKKLKHLLNCDIDIKTGKLKADFALEKLIVKLCCF